FFNQTSVWLGKSSRPVGVLQPDPVGFMSPAPCGGGGAGNVQPLGFVDPTGRKTKDGGRVQSIALYDPSVAKDGTLPPPDSCSDKPGGIRLLSPDPLLSSLHYLPDVYTFNRGAFCDVDGDGMDDFVDLAWKSPSYVMSVVYGGPDGWPAVPDL